MEMRHVKGDFYLPKFKPKSPNNLCSPFSAPIPNADEELKLKSVSNGFLYEM